MSCPSSILARSTSVIGPITVGFDSIDAPEMDQPGSEAARAALAGRLNGQEVALDVVTQDRYERLVAVVYLGDETINAWMVRPVVWRAARLAASRRP